MITIIGMEKPTGCSRCPFWCGNHCSIDLFLNPAERANSQFGDKVFDPETGCLSVCPIREVEENKRL